MTYLNILEKLQILFNMIFDFKVILIFMLLLVILTILYMVKVLNKKKYVLSMLLSFVLVFGISIISNYKILSNTFDNFATIFFGNIYFPSIYVYIISLVVVLICFITSILNKKLKKSYKVINSIVFVINNILLVIVLNIIAKNKIDIFSISSLYTNTNLVAILEISTSVIVIWLLSLLVVYATNCISEKLSTKKEIVSEEVKTNEVTVATETAIVSEEVDTADTVVMATETIEPEVTIETPTIEEKPVIENVVPTISTVVTPETIVIPEEDNLSFNDILNGGIEVVYYDNNVNNLEYNIINPQEIYESKYNPIKEEKVVEERPVVEVTITKKADLEKQSIEESSLIEKERLSKERLSINTVSLNELNDKEETILVDNKKENKYTIEDYKKFAKMLSDLKNNSRRSNITIDDAVTMSLISNYSIEDCIRFKEILESNLV